MPEPATTPRSHAHESMPPASSGRRGGRLQQYLELTKFRLSMLVVITTAVGYLLAVPLPAGLPSLVWTTLRLAGAGEWHLAGDLIIQISSHFHWPTFAITIIGTGLAACGTAGINQWMEADRDALMPRTKDRPLPTGAISRNEAFNVSTFMIIVGVSMLELWVNSMASVLTLFTAALYIAIYTPLKTRSTLNTLVGAVCGAIPPMIGWVAVTARLDLGAWILGGILFIWQLPHFLALAWMYKDDYARGGYRMLPSVDPTGQLTAQIALLTSLLLIPLSLFATMSQIAGYMFAIGAVALGALMIARSIALYLDRSRLNARRLFIASIVYLPLLMMLLVLDRGLGAEMNLPTLGPVTASTTPIG